MIFTDKQEKKDILYQGIKKWEERLVDFGGGIPWEFYIEYRDLLIRYKEYGETKESIIMNEIEKYKDLPEDLYHLFDEMTDEAYELFQKGQYKASFDKYEDCLKIFPNPKTDYGDYANVIEWMIQNYLQLKDYHNAKRWLEELKLCQKNTAILSDYDFLKGKVYFESSDYNVAWKCFDDVMRKKGERHFLNSDSKYLDFYNKYTKIL